MKISVIIPAYNAALWIQRAVDSVLSQTRPADEIIVVDDGSTDDTAAMVQSYGNRVILIRQSNAGVSIARNAGITAAGGDWIAFLDADDEWLGNRLQAQITLLKQYPTLKWVAGNFVILSASGETGREKLNSEKGIELLVGKVFFDDYFQAFIAGATGWTGTKLIRKDVFFQAGLFKQGLQVCEDLDMWWRIAYENPMIGYVPEPIAIYHTDTDQSLMKTNRDQKILGQLIERHLRLAKEKDSLEVFKPCAAHFLRFWMHNYFEDKRLSDIRPLMRQFGALFSPGYRLSMNLLSMYPPLTRMCLPGLRKINKLLKLPL